VSKCLCPIFHHEIQFYRLDEHIAQAHPEHDTAKNTGPQIPVAYEPSHEESGFYCNTCQRVVSAEEYEVHHRDHDKGIVPPNSS